MAKKFVKNDPPVISGVLCFLEEVEFDGVDKGASMCFITFGTHSVCDYNVLKAALVADVIVL